MVYLCTHVCMVAKTKTKMFNITQLSTPFIFHPWYSTILKFEILSLSPPPTKLQETGSRCS
jgi:hypothetical protein